MESVPDVEIPNCLWSLNNLTALYLTGNGYVGTIEPTNIGSSLENVSLSHNRLSGTIPQFILGLKNVDVSYNRFIGHLSGNDLGSMSNETILQTQVNRLSGRLPTSSLRRAYIVDILRGNMFSCATIPKNDVSSTGYICGNHMNLFKEGIIVSWQCILLCRIPTLRLFTLSDDCCACYTGRFVCICFL